MRTFKILAIIFVVAILGIAGFWYLNSVTDEYAKLVDTEIAALDAALERATTIVGQGAVNNAEAHQLHLDIHGHLNRISNHHPAVGLTGYQDHHVSSFQSAIEKLEQFLVTHRDILQAIEEASETYQIENQLAKKKSSGEQLFGSISTGISDTSDILSGHIEDV